MNESSEQLVRKLK